MRLAKNAPQHPGSAAPALHTKAVVLASYLHTIMPSDYEIIMKFSHEMAQKTHALMQQWSVNGATLPAIDSFLGDIYSGLQAQSFSEADRHYAHEHLRILSGLYGVVRALDAIQPYRLEMGYKLLGNAHDAAQPDITSLYAFWGDAIAKQLAKDVNGQPIINLSAKEYTKAVFPYFKHIKELKDILVISPQFLTISPKTQQPTFVTVHAKIARGAFARWIITHRIEDMDRLKEFNDIGYQYDATLSTPEEPVFVAKEFQGLGLSVRAT